MKAAGTKASLRVALNVALYDSKEVKVPEQGVMFFKDPVRVREKYGLEKWAFEIQRHGAAKDPKTTYSILPEHQQLGRAAEGLPGAPSTTSRSSYPARRTAAARRAASRSTATTRRATRRATAPWPQRRAGDSSPRSRRRCRARRRTSSSRSSASSASRTCRRRRWRRRAFVEQLQTESAAPAAAETEVDPFA